MKEIQDKDAWRVLLCATWKDSYFSEFSQNNNNEVLDFFASWVEVNDPKKKNYTAIQYLDKLGKTGPVKYYTISEKDT